MPLSVLYYTSWQAYSWRVFRAVVRSRNLRGGSAVVSKTVISSEHQPQTSTNCRQTRQETIFLALSLSPYLFIMTGELRVPHSCSESCVISIPVPCLYDCPWCFKQPSASQRQQFITLLSIFSKKKNDQH